MSLAKRMNDLTEYVTVAIKQNRNEPDPHLKICHETSDVFDLWEDDRFPLWLSFVVAGQMREMGIDDNLRR